MLGKLPDFAARPPSEDSVRWFQRTRALKVDGVAGPQTRRQLVTEYMALAGSAPKDAGLDLNITAHGCGENFPLDASGDNLDPDPKDPERDPTDRRVELFFFERDFGVQPPAPGKNSKPGSKEYPEWGRRAMVLSSKDLPTLRRIIIRILDDGEAVDGAHFRLTMGAEVHVGTASEGRVEISTTIFATEATLEWNPPGTGELGRLGGEPLHTLRVFLVKEPHPANFRAAERMLHNLGYDAIRGLRANVRSFQIDQRLEANGVLDEPTRAALLQQYAELSAV